MGVTTDWWSVPRRPGVGRGTRSGAGVRRAAALSAMALLAAGCTSTRRAQAPPPVEPDFAAGAALLSGFDAPRDETAWRGNDRILLGIRFEDEARPPRTWFLRATVLPASVEGTRSVQLTVPQPNGEPETLTLESRLAIALIELFDGAGTPLAKSTTFLPVDYLNASLASSVGEATAAPDAAEIDDQAVRDAVLGRQSGFLALMSFLEVIATNPALEPVREATAQRLVRRPGPFQTLGALAGGGISIAVLPDVTTASREPAGGLEGLGLGEAWRVPLRIEMEGTLILDASVVVLPSRPPYAISGGVFRLEAAHPERSATRLVVTVTAGRGGDPAAQTLN